MKAEFESEKLDQADLKILGHLRTNARKTLTRISKETRIPISSLFDRLKRLERINVIRRYTSLLDLKKIGIHVRILLLVKAHKGSKRNLEGWLKQKLQVNCLIRTNGQWKLAAECLFQIIENLESFIENFEKDFKGVEFSVHYILEDLKREGFLAGNSNFADRPIL